MRICRYNENRVGVIESGEVIDVTPIVNSLPNSRWPALRGDLFIACLEDLKPDLANLAKTGATRFNRAMTCSFDVYLSQSRIM